MADQVGSAYVSVDADTSPATAAFRKLQADADRTMADLSRKKAELEINAKTIEFDREIDKVKTEIDNLKRKKASITIEADTKQLDADIAEAEAELKSLTGKKRKITIDSRDLRNTNRDASLLAKTMATNEKLALDTAKANDHLAVSRQRDTQQVLKNRVELDKLSAQYEKLAGQRQKLEKSSRGVFSSRSIAESDREGRALSRVGNELELTKSRIESLGGSVKGLDPALSKDTNRLERWFTSLSKVRLSLGPLSGSLKQFAIGAGLLGPILTELGGGLISLIGVAGTGFAGAMSAGSAAAAGFGLSALGVGLILKPVISEIGAATKASEAYQKAVLKYGKGSTQAKTASEELSHTLKGISPGARSAIKEFGGLKTTWTKLTAAAKAPLFNAAAASIHTVKALLPSFARESVATTKTVAAGWEKWMAALRSPGAKEAINQIMGNFRAALPSIMSGFQSLATTIGHIATASSTFLPGLSKGFASWAQSIEQAVGSGAQLESKIGRLIGHMRDIGHLAQASGRFLVGFFNASADSGDNLVQSLTKTINKWNEWMATVHGQKSLKSFFSDSAGATKDFMSSLANLATLLFQVSRATAPLANGFLKIVTFIGNIVTAADKLVGVKTIIQGLGIIFGSLFVASKVMAYGDALQGVLVRLGLMSAAASEDVAATEALTAATAELTTALTAEAAAAAEADLALGAGGIAGAAAAADAGLGAGAAAATRAALGLDGATESAGLLGAALAPEVLIPAATLAALGILLTSTETQGSAFEELTEASKQAGHALQSNLKEGAQTTDRYIQAQHQNVAVTKEAAEARQRLIKLQNEGASTAKITQAVEALNAVEAKQAKQARETGIINEHQVKTQEAIERSAKQRVKTAEEAINLVKQEQAHAKQNGELASGAGGNALKAKFAERLAAAESTLAHAKREVADAQRAETVTSIPYERHLLGLKPLSEQAEEGLRKLSKTIGTFGTQKIGTFINPKDVEQATNLSNRLDKLGRGSQVKNIAVKSQGADQTIAKLQHLQKQTQRVEGARATIKVGANDTQAQSRLKRLGALSQRLAGTNPTVHILATSNSAEGAINRLKHHLTTLVTHQYKAELKAEDKSGAAASAFHHNLSRAATTKYQAHITAIDDASSKAKSAQQASEAAGRQHPKINITASNSQALGAIAATQSALAGLHDKTVTVNVVTNKSGHYAGGESMYVPFAAGGMSDKQMERAYNQAGEERGGGSRKVNKPTMLVGEQPGQPEYVIATNPSYRADNERYLDQAANDLGYNLVPAHAKGKGKKGGKGGGGSGGGAPSPPYKHQSKNHWNVHKHRFAPDSVNQFNTAENTLRSEEHFFNAELSREEQEISHKKRAAYDFPTLRGYLQRERGIEERIINDLIPAIASASNKAYNTADTELKGPLSAKTVHSAQKVAAGLSKEYSNMQTPTKGKNESDHDYKKRVQVYERRKKEKKAQAKEAENYAKRLEKERTEAQKVKEEARQELTEVRQEVRDEHRASLKELNTEETNYEEIEANPEFAPYYNAEKAAGGSTPTPGEETATLSAARENLYNEMGSNVYNNASPGGGSASAAAASGRGVQPAGTNAVTTSAAAGSGMAALFGPRGGGSSPIAAAAGLAAGAKITNVTNNFAAPPPDPHTWTKNQQFELGALA